MLWEAQWHPEIHNCANSSAFTRRHKKCDSDCRYLSPEFPYLSQWRWTEPSDEHDYVWTADFYFPHSHPTCSGTCHSVDEIFPYDRRLHHFLEVTSRPRLWRCRHINTDDRVPFPHHPAPLPQSLKHSNVRGRQAGAVWWWGTTFPAPCVQLGSAGVSNIQPPCNSYYTSRKACQTCDVEPYLQTSYCRPICYCTH